MRDLVKEFIEALAAPLTVAFIVAAVGAVLWVRRRRRVAGWLLLSATLIVYVASLRPVGDALLDPLERQYPSFDVVNSSPAVDFVVVLGSGYSPRPGVSAASALDEEGLARIVEGVRLVRHLGTARLVVSGGASAGSAPSAHGYADLARELGISGTSIVLLDEPRDTATEARMVAAVVGRARFILVTSAYHMPRAVRLMARVGARPIPAPTGQRVGASYAHYWSYLLPSSAGLRMTEHAIHEYLGLAALAVDLS